MGSKFLKEKIGSSRYSRHKLLKGIKNGQTSYKTHFGAILFSGVLMLSIFFLISSSSEFVMADNVVPSASGYFNITETPVNTNTSISLTLNLTGSGNVSAINITAPAPSFNGGDLWVKDVNTFNGSSSSWTNGTQNTTIRGTNANGNRFVNITLNPYFNSTSPNDKIAINFTAVSGSVPANGTFRIQLFNGTGANSGPITVSEKSEGSLRIEVIDNTPPQIVDTTSGSPTTGESYVITATVTDNVGVSSVHLYYWFETTTGNTAAQNSTMNDLGSGNYDYTVSVPSNALVLHYNISATDTSDNWGQTGDLTITVLDNDPPQIVDTTSGSPTTGESYVITATVTDNVGVSSVHLYYWFETTTGNTAAQNSTMNDLGSGNYDYTVSVPSNALVLHYNISATDTSDNWGQTGDLTKSITDNDNPSSKANILPEYETTAPFTVYFTCSDNINVSYVELWYRFNGGNWTKYNLSGNSRWKPGEIIEFKNCTEDGSYDFYTIAVDSATNRETVPIGKDAYTTLDRYSPTSSLPDLPIYESSKTFEIPFNASDNGSGVKTVELFYRYNNGSWISYGNFTSSPITFVANNGEGLYEFYIVSTDNVNNIENKTAISEVNTTLDITPPTTNLNLSGSLGDNGWYNSSVSITLTTSDSSGVNAKYYRIDGGKWNAYNGSFNISDDGIHTIEFYSIDNASNMETTNSTTVKIDMSLPTTSISVIGTIGNNGWYTSDVNISLSSSDTFSGIHYLNYSVDGQAWQTYTGSFSISSEGTHTIEFNATDFAGNKEVTRSITVDIDKIAPITQATPNGSPNSAGWYNSQVVITLRSTDSISGFSITYYRLDGGAWNAYNGPFSIADDGVHTIGFYSIDNAGNMETTNSLTVKIDMSLPTTSISVIGTIGNNGWYTSDVNISLSSSDTFSGIHYLNYSIDGQAWQTYTGSFSISSEGNHTIEFNATDLAGNNELTRSVLIKIDNTAPVTLATPDRSPNSAGWYNSSVAITLTPFDSLSGVNVAYYRIDGGVWKIYGLPFSITDDGIHTIDFYSVDVAGNSEYLHTLKICLDSEKTYMVVHTNIDIDSAGAHFVVLFNEEMNPDSFNGNISIEGGQNIEIKDMVWTNNNKRLEVFLDNVDYGTAYTITFSKVSDVHGNLYSSSVDTYSSEKPRESFNFSLLLFIPILIILALIILMAFSKQPEPPLPPSLGSDWRIDRILEILEGRGGAEPPDDGSASGPEPETGYTGSVYTNIPNDRITGKIELIGKEYRLYVTKSMNLKKQTFERVLEKDKLELLEGLDIEISTRADGEMVLKNNTTFPVSLNGKPVPIGEEVHIGDSGILKLADVVVLKFSAIRGE